MSESDGADMESSASVPSGSDLDESSLNDTDSDASDRDSMDLDDQDLDKDLDDNDTEDSDLDDNDLDDSDLVGLDSNNASLDQSPELATRPHTSEGSLVRPKHIHLNLLSLIANMNV